jgi:hypothetical protein
MDGAKPTFTAHNIVLDDGTQTRPESQMKMGEHPWCISALRTLSTVFPGDKSGIRIADLGCLEGGYAVEFARSGFQVLGLEVRESNFAACQYVKSNVNLPNLEFVQDNAWNIATYGEFDAIFCCGLLYHLDRPNAFLNLLGSATRKCLLLHTHFAHADTGADHLPKNESMNSPQSSPTNKFNLSEVMRHEGLLGRWYTEYSNEPTDEFMEEHRWASWGNKKSFWICREDLIGAINAAGFNIVLEQFDCLGPDIANSMLTGFYRTDRRSMFVGIKTG